MHEYYPPELLKEWEEASLSNNFIFCKVMSENLDICKEFLEMLLNIQIESISLAQPEKTLDVDFFAKGIRLDVFVKDETDRSYDIEMQVIGKKHLPLRARYYQSVLDISSLHAGDDYECLAESYVIFLCLEDIFHKGLPIYTFKSVCTEDRELFLNDKTTKVFCNAQKYDKMPAEKLRTFFKFLLENKPDETAFSKTLSEKVLKAKIPEDSRRTFMTLEQEIKLAAKHAAQEAAEKASKEGYEKGYKEAEKEKEIAVKKAAENNARNNAIKLKESGVSVEIISKCTGLSLEEIQEL
ncbi:Rpn family recombination-promoting nuclease/putative transposase [Treponema porcinum]|uniref:Rpn family recombination-promoting nuclease/putative transposase n=1 Tax=Treponema porcinum TaxID=261392 RepID=UPI002A817F36|nr:Rpn family recombination-promoting nuclease/putative transposase [Treponema porcinum]MDY4467487.1 Rpn family recombination-promoting nuclease/putative transposase [Treponema porcinum]